MVQLQAASASAIVALGMTSAKCAVVALLVGFEGRPLHPVSCGYSPGESDACSAAFSSATDPFSAAISDARAFPASVSVE